MRSYSLLSIGLLLVGALACEAKGGDSDTAALTDGGSDSSSDGSGTEGVSTTSGDPATTGDGTAASAGSSASGASTADPGTTTGPVMTTGIDTSSSSVGTSDTSTVGTSDTTGAPTEPQPCEGPAKEIQAHTIAYLYSQIPPDPDTTGGTTAGTGGDLPDPDVLFVRLSGKASTCADPSPTLECGPNWEVTIRIPPEFQTPGLYHLAGSDVTGHAAETGEDYGDGTCSFGGGTFFATFELISIDDKNVTGRLCHVQDWFFDNQVDLEGSFTAPRCP